MKNYAVEQRLRFIDAMLYIYGCINREALMYFFGVSTPQASNDIKAYMEAAPGNMIYDKSAKRYVRSSQFRSHYS